MKLWLNDDREIIPFWISQWRKTNTTSYCYYIQPSGGTLSLLLIRQIICISRFLYVHNLLLVHVYIEHIHSLHKQFCSTKIKKTQNKKMCSTYVYLIRLDRMTFVQNNALKCFRDVYVTHQSHQHDALLIWMWALPSLMPLNKYQMNSNRVR